MYTGSWWQKWETVRKGWDAIVWTESPSIKRSVFLGFLQILLDLLSICLAKNLSNDICFLSRCWKCFCCTLLLLYQGDILENFAQIFQIKEIGTSSLPRKIFSLHNCLLLLPYLVIKKNKKKNNPKKTMKLRSRHGKFKQGCLWNAWDTVTRDVLFCFF